MATEKKKYSVLVAGSGGRIFEYIAGQLPSSDYDPIRSAEDAAGVRRTLLTQNVDLVIINTPLADSSGIDLAIELSQSVRGVLLLVKKDMYEQVCQAVEDLGIMTLAKPMTGQSFYSAVKLLTAMTARLERMNRQNQTLQEKMADIRIVNRAKWLLIEQHRMTEQDAHYYIEKQAMDTRLTRREIAEGIIRTYDK